MQNVAAAPAFDDRLPHDRFHRANSSPPSPPRLRRLPLIARALIHTNNVSNLSNGWQTTEGFSLPHSQSQHFLPHRLSIDCSHSIRRQRCTAFAYSDRVGDVTDRPKYPVGTEHEWDIDCRIDMRLRHPLQSTTRSELYARINIFFCRSE